MMSYFFDCPHCGAEVPEGALACPVCGSDEETGWSDAAVYGELPPYDADPAGPSHPWKAGSRILIALIAALALAGILSQSLPIPLALVVTLSASAVGAALFLNRRRLARSMQSEDRLYQSLLRMAMGDEALVGRLIDYEEQRSPSTHRREHIQDAIDRWLRDAR